jgi:outer membrane protein
MLNRLLRVAGSGLCAVLLLLMSLQAQAEELKLGVMNVQRVLVGCAAGKAAKLRFDEKMQELQASLQGEEDALLEMQNDIEKKSSAWSEDTKQEKMREFQRKRREAQEKAEDARFELKTMQDKELDPILKTLEQVVKAYGEAHGYSLLIDSRSGVLHVAQGIDITDKIIVELDAAMAKQ